LIQQTSNYLISAYDEFVKTGKLTEMPLQTLSFLKLFANFGQMKFEARSKQDLLSESGFEILLSI
jgi:hypothetical protein